MLTPTTQELILIEELEEKNAPGSIMPGPVTPSGTGGAFQPCTIVWDNM